MKIPPSVRVPRDTADRRRHLDIARNRLRAVHWMQQRGLALYTQVHVSKLSR